jgi:hypothetical protein
LGGFLALGGTFTGGLFVAVGDVNGDGFGDIIVGADAGGLPAVEVFSGKDGSVLGAFLAFTPNFSGGVRVAAGDINNDGRTDIITGAGPGGLPIVAVYDLTNGSASLVSSFLAFNSSVPGGIYVAAGNVDGVPGDEVIVGAGAGGLPAVRVFSGVAATPGPAFLAFDGSFAGGVRVATADVNGDGRQDILAGAGPGGLPAVIGYDAFSLAVLDSFFAFDPQFHGGVFVG